MKVKWRIECTIYCEINVTRKEKSRDFSRHSTKFFEILWLLKQHTYRKLLAIRKSGDIPRVYFVTLFAPIEQASGAVWITTECAFSRAQASANVSRVKLRSAVAFHPRRLDAKNKPLVPLLPLWPPPFLGREEIHLPRAISTIFLNFTSVSYDLYNIFIT